MREIRFRAWIFDQKKMIYGDLQEVGKWSFPLYWCSLMRFTGLKDLNGKEIYEGDILALEFFSSWIVCWYDTGFHIYNVCNPAQKFPLSTIVGRTSIGNIYENPELIGSK